MNTFQTICESNINLVLKRILIRYQKQVNSGTELNDLIGDNKVTIDKTKKLITNTADIIIKNDSNYVNVLKKSSKIEDQVITQNQITKSIYQKIINYIYNYVAYLIENNDINLTYACIDHDTLFLTVQLSPIENKMPKNKEIDQAFTSLLKHGFMPLKRRYNEENPASYTPATYVYVNYQNEPLFILKQDDNRSFIKILTNQIHFDTSHFILNQQNNMPDKIAYFAKALNCINQL